MKKYFIVVLLMFGFGFSLQAQFIQTEIGADGMSQLPVSTVSRAEFLSLSPDLQVQTRRYRISDIVMQVSPPAVSDGKFYFTEAEFYATSEPRRLQILTHPETYIVVENKDVLPKYRIKETEVEVLPRDKQDFIRNSETYLIIE